MRVKPLRETIESFDHAGPLLAAWNLRERERGWRNLTHLATTIGLDALTPLANALGHFLPTCPDPDRALNSLERFLANPAGAAELPRLIEHAGQSLEPLLQLFGASQLFGDLLSLNPGDIDLVRAPLRGSPTRDELCAELRAAATAATDEPALLRAFRRFRQRQVLRVGINDVIRDRPLEEVTGDLSTVAEAAVEVALQTALGHAAARFGEPVDRAGRPIGCTVLAFGKLGGRELNYSSDIDLMFVYADDGVARGPRDELVGVEELYGRVVGEVVRLLSAHTDRGLAYRVDLRLRPEGGHGPLARSLDSTLSYYDTMGRTWERQALIKARPIAGDLALGERFVAAIEPFIYRKYLSFSEINEIKALKRRVEQKAERDRGDADVKVGPGGIRDIEFATQFLQLLNGGDHADLRQRNTLAALQALERDGCLTDLEFRVLDDAYRFLRKVEHRLQLLLDLQTHRLPDGQSELAMLARRLGYSASAPSPGEAFAADYRDKTGVTRRILNHLLHQTFADEPESAEPESDLILDPDPDGEAVRSVLGRYRFRDVAAAYHNLSQLARESVPFLSARRCRHFLASIAPALLRAVADTPDPDLALLNLEKVTASLGAKAVLWELFSFNPPTLKLYVDLCAWSPFLSELLINNPGMIDELLDSLVLNQPRSAAELRAELAELCRGATDRDPILHSFQDKEFVRIGVRDILGKATIRETTGELSALAETILTQVAEPQYQPVVDRFGEPRLADGPRAGQLSRFVVLALGKLGARSMSYHSDLDLILVYEGDGRPAATSRTGRYEPFEPTDNLHFFTELAQRIIRAASFLGPMGRLYQVDMRLRPTGKSGSLVTSLAEFRRYFGVAAPSGEPAAGGAQLWERLALTHARVVLGEENFAREVAGSVTEALYRGDWQPGWIEEVRAMRDRLAASRSDRHLKRGRGGLVDVEFLVELLQLKHGRRHPSLHTTCSWQALDALRAAELLSPREHADLKAAYEFLLRVQSRLRIVHNRSLDEVPAGSDDLAKLARRLGLDDGAAFAAELKRHQTRTRELFDTILAREHAAIN